jgi:hypothetical protein
MMSWDIVAVCILKHMKQLKTLYGQNEEMFRHIKWNLA